MGLVLEFAVSIRESQYSIFAPTEGSSSKPWYHFIECFDQVAGDLLSKNDTINSLLVQSNSMVLSHRNADQSLYVRSLKEGVDGVLDFESLTHFSSQPKIVVCIM